MKNDFFDRAKLYFKDNYDDFVRSLNLAPTHGFYLNTYKSSKEDIFKIIDFDYKESSLNENSYYTNYENIGKTKAYELGLIYPQDIESTIQITKIKKNNPKIIVDLCAAPGGKSINMINKYNDALFILNDISYKRASILSSNIERLGLNKNCIITNKDPKDLLNILKGNVDIVILDAPCSGEGMIRKYNEILDNYNINNINELSNIQRGLLDVAYNLINKDGLIIYSTCTYAFEEDENQIETFLNNHSDTELINIDIDNNFSTLKGTIKVCPLNNTEGQFISIIKRNSENEINKIKYLKPTNNKIVEEFIKENIEIDKYYLYSKDNQYFISLTLLIDLNHNVIRNGIYIGELKKDRFEPSHCLYRQKLIFKKFVEIDDFEYNKYICGNELFRNIDDGYYLVKYKGYSLGFVKASKGSLKNKYPKGLRRVII